MLLTRKAIVKWNSKIKKHYVELGYVFTKMGDEFKVNVKDLTDGSHIKVKIRCDYCKKPYFKHWGNYLIENKNSNIHKDACTKCKHKKASESVSKTYGVDNVFKLDDVKEKISKTNLEIYGVENPFQSELIKDKIKAHHMKTYGFESHAKSPIIKEKMRQFYLKNYGVEYSPALKKGQQKGELSPNWKGGALRSGNFRLTYQYHDWHDEVLKRDNYVCQCCGDVNGNGHTVKLHTHHIFNFADYEDLRFEVDNGITLCKSCHIKFHSTYGRRNNNKNQLKEFIFNYGKKIC